MEKMNRNTKQSVLYNLLIPELKPQPSGGKATAVPTEPQPVQTCNHCVPKIHFNLHLNKSSIGCEKVGNVKKILNFCQIQDHANVS